MRIGSRSATVTTTPTSKPPRRHLQASRQDDTYKQAAKTTKHEQMDDVVMNLIKCIANITLVSLLLNRLLVIFYVR